jgi:hypothetical protein
MSRPETIKLWRERLRRFDRAQMTVAQFCLSEGVSQPSFYQWKKKLRGVASDAKTVDSDSSVQFMPLRLTSELGNQAGPASKKQADSPLASTTIELPGGVRIRVDVPTDRQPDQRWEART